MFFISNNKLKNFKQNKPSEQFDILLQPDCKALKSIWNGDEGEAEKKSKAASELSQQGGERIEENLERNTLWCFAELLYYLLLKLGVVWHSPDANSNLVLRNFDQD